MVATNPPSTVEIDAGMHTAERAACGAEWSDSQGSAAADGLAVASRHVGQRATAWPAWQSVVCDSMAVHVCRRVLFGLCTQR